MLRELTYARAFRYAEPLYFVKKFAVLILLCQKKKTPDLRVVFFN